MIQMLLSRFQRGKPQAGDELLLHAWTNEDTTWHVSSRELARGLDVTELAVLARSACDRPRMPAVFLDTLPAVYDTQR